MKQINIRMTAKTGGFFLNTIRVKSFNLVKVHVQYVKLNHYTQRICFNKLYKSHLLISFTL